MAKTTPKEEEVIVIAPATLDEVREALQVFKSTLLASNVQFKTQIEARVQDAEAYLSQQ
jgi:hypothetical protein